MKKNILLVVMFIGIFVMNTREIYALKCEVGKGECADKNTLIERLKEETNGGNVVCLYEVKFKEKQYYNYIYYDGIENVLMGGTSFGAVDKALRNDKNAYLLGSAYNNLFNNYVCPSHSYIDKSAVNEVCFDNAGECKNNGEKYNNSTNFNDTSESKLIYTNTGAISLKDLSFKNACNAIPDGYDKVCRYSGKQDILIIYYNDSSYQVQYKNDETGQRVSINKGETQILNKEINTVDNTLRYTEYVSKLTIGNSCPSNVYVNHYSIGVIDENYDPNSNVVQKYTGIIDQITFETKAATPGKDGRFTIGNKEYETMQSKKLNYSKCDIDVVGDENPDPETCKDLFDEELLNVINEIMNLIKIAVPILLIGLIIYDFASAVFASSDDKVNKAKQRAIKRIVIAVVIFFVPTLINFVLNLVNDVWGKNYGICGIEDKTE